ncbi:MAG: AEC family transporter [Gammaproteobacteria bacterium]|nr:AEC family transporter [Gammaproteobacteria bacterium]MCW8840365.1 AEC family transporter [Gammaproteobacteria bacterium]MCW8958578.1 AEC family transporter [Gammaproteobacteria bacterium]MCW8972764.1 AEC family transporter [Gammaproteobacteria bacterium]MCW8993014.1 AEC family transporter [Gammaproteobacteria bacterium]
MYEVIGQAAILILCGVLWRVITPQGLDADTLRNSLTTLVYMLLLPALVLVVLWRAELTLDAIKVALLATLGIGVGMGVAWLWFRRKRPAAAALGALLLAAAFPNATYMGLPVLEASLGPWARAVAIQYDLFACTPLLLSAGVMLAQHYGGSGESAHPLRNLLRVPPLWAALAGVALNLGQMPLPSLAGGVMDMLAAGVVPLMLFSLGLGLRWGSGWGNRLALVMPVVLIQLLITPLVVYGASDLAGLQGAVRTAVVLEAAMPSMVLGIVLCDRYRLDTNLYAMAVTLSTALSIVTLPMWFALAGV